jgi:glycosyltransferase involved in cell wall biosynthesis
MARRIGAGLLHCPHYTMPVLTRVPVVVTLHDATFFTHPAAHSRTKRLFFRAWTHVSLRRAHRVVVPSRATKEELVRVVGARADRIDVAHLGVDARRFHVPGDDRRRAVRELLGLGDQPYVAFLGTIEPRKNVPALIRAWIDACRDRPSAPALVLAGARGWDTEVEGALAEVPEQLRCVQAGYLPLDTLAGLLGEAELVAYPSLGEGFGLPVLEAMACGAAVLTTRELSLPEVGGDAVAYTGTSRREIGEALGHLLDDPGRRAELAALAVRRAATFTWRACALAHLAAYDAALETTPRRR